MQRRSQVSDEGWLLAYADLLTNLIIFFAVLLGAAELSRSRMQEIAQDLSGVEQPESLASIQREIEEHIAEAGLNEDIRTDLTNDGLKLSLNSGLVFDVGRGQIRPAQQAMLDTMLETLVPYKNQYGFAVEGHTDSTPFSSDPAGPSNWDLSTERANAVRRRLEAIGIAPERVRVEGYADTVPLPEEELTGLSATERLARHRRVVVRVY